MKRSILVMLIIVVPYGIAGVAFLWSWCKAAQRGDSILSGREREGMNNNP